jgi:hypothetical protein|tara:strand:- start:1294 stop:1908 length:615 start_codon:yes stop_codon:yes gene_type:complete
MWTLPKEVILKALECCRDIYPHEDDVLIDRSIDGYTILAIEGTKEKTDWLTNIKFLLKSDDCHRGFKNNSYRSLSKLVCDYEALDKKRKLIITGHSLGGATATLIADLIYPNNQNIALITAGSPRPGGRELRERLKNVEHLRFVYGDDIVPKTPPWVCGYVHTHQPIPLEDANDTRFDGVADHNMGSYYDAAVKFFNPNKKVVL